MDAALFQLEKIESFLEDAIEHNTQVRLNLRERSFHQHVEKFGGDSDLHDQYMDYLHNVQNLQRAHEHRHDDGDGGSYQMWIALAADARKQDYAGTAKQLRNALLGKAPTVQRARVRIRISTSQTPRSEFPEVLG